MDLRINFAAGKAVRTHPIHVITFILLVFCLTSCQNQSSSSGENDTTRTDTIKTSQGQQEQEMLPLLYIDKDTFDKFYDRKERRATFQFYRIKQDLPLTLMAWKGEDKPRDEEYDTSKTLTLEYYDMDGAIPLKDSVVLGAQKLTRKDLGEIIRSNGRYVMFQPVDTVIHKIHHIYFYIFVSNSREKFSPKITTYYFSNPSPPASIRTAMRQ